MSSEAKIIPASDIQFSAELAPVKESLQKARAIVLMDLDGTVIDENYAVKNLRGLKRAIALLQEANILVGLHSDTPRTSLLQFAQMYGIQGPLIYEMAGIHLPGFDSDIVLEPSVKDFYTVLRDKFFEVAKSRLFDTENIRYIISKDRDKNKERREKVTYPGYGFGVFINPFRQFSLGYWTEEFDSQGVPHNDVDFHNVVDDLLRECLSDSSIPVEGLYFYRNSVEDGTTIIRPSKLQTKLPTIHTLLTIGEYQKPVYMIGNTKSDYIPDSRVITLAVGNADQALTDLIQKDEKALSPRIQRIARRTYTNGVIEHLNSILLSHKT